MGVWTYGEWGQTFKPSGAQASLPVGGLYLDEAGMNLIFDMSAVSTCGPDLRL